LGPYLIVGQVCDVANLSKAAFKKPDLVNKVMEVTTDFIISLAKIYREAGADYVTVREMGAGPDILSPRLFKSLVRPHLERIFANIESPNVLHICGDTDLIVDQIALCGADAISVEEKNHVAQTRQKVGPDALIFGNIAGFTTLVNGKADEIDKAVREAIANGVNAIWPGCDIWPTVPKENMEALMSAARKYGEFK
jgi:[methyl-Co(III) methanol-specific corrinoid protein]:coenzyme M methyltransferase